LVVLVSAAACALGSSHPASGLELQESLPGQECGGKVPNCKTVESALFEARPDNKRHVKVLCPSKAPFFWNWSADVSRHVQTQLVQPVLNDADEEVGAIFRVHPQGSAAGAARIHLACSAQRPSENHPVSFRYQGFGWHPYE
jgi:hypothetical protein